MKVYKFGGASIKDYKSVKRLVKIIRKIITIKWFLSFQLWVKQQIQWKILFYHIQNL